MLAILKEKTSVFITDNKGQTIKENIVSIQERFNKTIVNNRYIFKADHSIGLVLGDDKVNPDVVTTFYDSNYSNYKEAIKNYLNEQ